ncbi:MAG: alcohol dehydrogenase catalytic domain-containing protein [Lentisphaerae bacterium]|jgi:2-desacetyl-2-hydroxyethyl bacteriochlorophyllide A dehydrogenase|nr:alcohol dehydrogenase catalytic domain-containing protein [Lentisphaerota bacterium]
MKAAQYIKAGEIAYQDVPVSPLGDDELRIKVAYCGICGTDLHIFKGHMDARVRAPQAIGHEVSGTVAEVGKNVSDFRINEKVTVRPLDNCGTCNTCRAGFTHICEKLRFLGIETAGAFAQYWTVPARLVHHLPETLPLKLAALVEPLAVACHDVRRSELKPDDKVVVSGGGPIGMLIALCARATGGRVTISEINEKRLALARSLGFDAVNPQQTDLVAKVRAETGGSGADVVFEVSGSEAGAKVMTELARPRATIVMVAIFAKPAPVDLHKFFWKELRMVGARVYEYEDYEKAIRLVADKALPLESLISSVFPLAQLQDAFDYLTKSPDAMKVLIQCNEEIQ